MRERSTALATSPSSRENDDEALGLLKASLSCAKQVEAKPEAALAAAHRAVQIGRGPQAAAAAGEEAVALAREARDDYVLAIALKTSARRAGRLQIPSVRVPTTRKAWSCVVALATCPGSPSR